MKPNTIPRLLDYYFDEEDFVEEMERAVEEFFGDQGSKTDVKMDENIEEHFNEWLVFDFILENGKSLLRDFYDCNPCNLSKGELKIYQDLQNNEYAMFEVLEVKKGKGLEILSLQSGKKYFVDEFMGTFQIAKGNVFPGRVGKVGDRWELAGCNALLFKTKISQETKKNFLDAKEKITPKIIYDVFLAKKEPDNQRKNIDFGSEENKLSLEEIEKRLDEQLDRLGIKKHISVDLIKEWISDLEWKRNENIISNISPMLAGLIDVEHDQGDLEKLISPLIRLHNLTPQKNLGGKAPSEMRIEKDKKKEDNREDEVILESDEWFRYSKKAFEFLQKKENEEALKYYNKSFETLLKDKTTHHEIYRFFANKATAHFALGEERKAVKLLEMALELNPNYDFARDTLNRYKDGGYDSLMLRGSFKKIAENIKKIKGKKRAKKFENDPAIIYFNYLQKFKINFATKELTVSDITLIGPNGEIERIKGKRKKVGRNDPCHCGSGKKFKKCCGR